MSLAEAPAAASDPAQGRLGALRARAATPAWLALPLIVFLGVFYLAPVALMLARAAGEGDWAPLFAAVENQVAQRVFLGTLEIAFVCTLATLVIGYPLALFAALAPPWLARIAIAAVLAPFWSSILIRSYAWMVLLGREGLVNGALGGLGLIEAPIRMLNTTFAVYVGMIHIMLPFMILPIYAALKGIDGRLVQAAENLGASTASVLRHVILPLSAPGVAAGALVVFVLSIGFYVTPALLGGPRDMMVSMLIAQEVDLYNWDLASAYAGGLLAITLLIVAVASRFVDLGKAMGGRG